MVKKSSYFGICAKHRPKMEGVVLNRVGISQIFFVLNRVKASDSQRNPNT